MPALRKVGKPVWDSELPTLHRSFLGWNLRAPVRESHEGRGWALKEGHALTFGLEWGSGPAQGATSSWGCNVS